MEREKVNNIYSHLSDDLSQKIYMCRMSFILSGDSDYLMDMIKYSQVYSRIKSMITDAGRGYIWGAGVYGKNLVKLFKQSSFKGFIDSNNIGVCVGLDVFKPDEFFDNYNDEVIYVSSLRFHEEIIRQLREHHIDDKHIVDIGGFVDDYCRNNQYFDLEALSESTHAYSEEEVFVDCGCFDGKTTENFMKWSIARKNFAYAFEPDSRNFELCDSVLDDICHGNYSLIKKGLWSKKDRIRFDSSGTDGAHISDAGNGFIEVESIDNLVNKNISFIKMDIEGAELEALKGAKNTIKAFRPRLAISLYHNEEDLWDIPEYILSLNPDYKLYLRHYTLDASDTVLFAV